jgi:hypothetical protein
MLRRMRTTLHARILKSAHATRFRIACALSAGLLLNVMLIGCGERQETPDQSDTLDVGESRATSTGDLLAQRSDLEAREVSWSAGDATSRATGYFRGSLLVYIDEEMDRGEYGLTREEYLLHDNQLIHFRRTGRMLTQYTADRPANQEVETEILFNPDGSARVVRNLGGGVDRELGSAELEAIRTHFALIRDRLAAAQQ